MRGERARVCKHKLVYRAPLRNVEARYGGRFHVIGRG